MKFTKQTRHLVEDVCTDLVWASWLDTVSPKGKLEINNAVRKLADHFDIGLHKMDKHHDTTTS